MLHTWSSSVISLWHLLIWHMILLVPRELLIGAVHSIRVSRFGVCLGEPVILQNNKMYSLTFFYFYYFAIISFNPLEFIFLYNVEGLWLYSMASLSHTNLSLTDLKRPLYSQTKFKLYYIYEYRYIHDFAYCVTYVSTRWPVPIPHCFNWIYRLILRELPSSQYWVFLFRNIS